MYTNPYLRGIFYDTHYNYLAWFKLEATLNCPYVIESNHMCYLSSYMVSLSSSTQLYVLYKELYGQGITFNVFSRLGKGLLRKYQTWGLFGEVERKILVNNLVCVFPYNWSIVCNVNIKFWVVVLSFHYHQIWHPIWRK